jgi:hypothetical protein
MKKIHSGAEIMGIPIRMDKSIPSYVPMEKKIKGELR